MQIKTTDNRDSPNVFAIVPAAGRSRRMGRCKQLLEIDGLPMLLGIIQQLAASRIAGIAIVTRREIEDTLRSHPLAAAHIQAWRCDSSPDVVFAYDQADNAEMIDSVRIGIQTWKLRESSAASDGLLVCPADHPGITAADFNACIAAFQSEPHRIIIASRNGKQIASALNLFNHDVLYGRYWGALEYHPNLHFETCYYQGIKFCIEHKIAIFEGGAQGEHKLARGFLPVTTWSAHWLAHPQFSRAVEDSLKRESGNITRHMDELNDSNPFKRVLTS